MKASSTNVNFATKFLVPLTDVTVYLDISAGKKIIKISTLTLHVRLTLMHILNISVFIKA